MELVYELSIDTKIANLEPEALPTTEALMAIHCAAAKHGGLIR